MSDSKVVSHPDLCPITKAKRSLTELVIKNVTSATRRRDAIKKHRKTQRLVLKECTRIARKKGLRAVALTLTYSNASKFKSRHISDFIDKLRKRVKRLGFSMPYLWSLEQAKKVLHYHLILWLPRNFSLTKKVLVTLWAHGSTWIQNCKSPKAWVKYIGKEQTKINLPGSARGFGHGGLDNEGVFEVARGKLPLWLQAQIPVGVIPKRHSFGWVIEDTGELFESPYIWTPSGIRLKVAGEFNLPNAVHAGPSPD